MDSKSDSAITNTYVETASSSRLECRNVNKLEPVLMLSDII